MPARTFDSAGPAVCLHDGQERDRRRNDHRRHGPALYRPLFWLLHCLERDSDFARLAARIREQGVTVYGFGERKTPRLFITACDKFVYFDVLNAPGERKEAEAAAAPKAPAAKPAPAKTRLDRAALDMLSKAVTASADEDGRANLGRVGAHLAKQSPDFDPRNYGFARLSNLVEASGIVQIERIGENPKLIMVRLKADTRPRPTK